MNKAINCIMIICLLTCAYGVYAGIEKQNHIYKESKV